MCVSGGSASTTPDPNSNQGVGIPYLLDLHVNHDVSVDGRFPYTGLQETKEIPRCCIGMFSLKRKRYSNTTFCSKIKQLVTMCSVKFQQQNNTPWMF